MSSIFYQYLNNKILKTASLPQHEKSRHVFEKIFKYVVIEAIIAVLSLYDLLVISSALQDEPLPF